MKLKKLVSLLLAGVMVVSLAACTPSTGTPSENPTQAGDNVIEGYSQSPTISADLGTVESRLPVAEDIFVERYDSTGKPLAIGNYGGTLNLVSGTSDWHISRSCLESIIHYNSDGSYYPNVVKEIKYNEDYTEWTFVLREGMRWSDGELFTADDITFWYYMCHLSDLDTKKDGWKWLLDGKDEEGNNKYPTLRKDNDYQVTWIFTNSKNPSSFIEDVDAKWCWAPEHYLNDIIPSSKYYPNDYYPDTGLTDEQVKANGLAKGIDFATWKQFGRAFTYYPWGTPGLPTLNAWVLSTDEDKDDYKGECEMVRNPYFWKVDATGQQLPYVDTLSYKVVDAANQELKFMSGELSSLAVEMSAVQTILESKGDAVALRTVSSDAWGTCQVTFNYTTTDANLAALFANIKFREAMSIAVDRVELSELLSDGFLLPGQCAPSAGTFGYSEEWSNKWVKQDIDRAKQLLAECGLTMGSDGYYKFADGTTVEIPFYSAVEYNTGKTFEVLNKYWKQIGVKCVFAEYETGTYDLKVDNNEWFACINPRTTIGGTQLGDRAPVMAPISQLCEWYGEYGTYYQNSGNKGVKPTGAMAELVTLYDQWIAASEKSVQDEYAAKIYKLHEENMWTIAFLQAEATYTIIDAKLGNYPDKYVTMDKYMNDNMIHFWTVYIAK